MSIFTDDELILAPSSSSINSSSSALQYFDLLESFYEEPLYDDQPREFVISSGESTLQLSGDTPSLVLIEDANTTQASITGGSHVFLLKGSMSNLAIEGGSVQVFLEELPDSDTVFSISGGLLEINILPSEFGKSPVIDIEDGRVIVDGEPSTILLSGGVLGDPQGIVKLSSLNDVQQLIIPPAAIPESIGDGSEASSGAEDAVLDDSESFYLSDEEIEALIAATEPEISFFSGSSVVSADDLYASDIESFVVDTGSLFANEDPVHLIEPLDTLDSIAMTVDIFAEGIQIEEVDYLTI